MMTTGGSSLFMGNKIFSKGDTVIYVSGRYANRPDNPLSSPANGIFYQGKVTDVMGNNGCRVEWFNGTWNTYDFEDLEMYSDYKLEKKTMNTLNLDELNKVVIEEGSKKELVSVLKQHENKSKIFDEWGLGEVLEYGKGMTFLFHGPPGTGKTWASHCIARSMGMDLLEVSSAEIQTSEPGGANRNIKEAFQEASRNNKVLLFDECDSLITVRSTVGMILSSEINTLLTEIEKFEGICILSTNRIGALDEALERRIALIVKFPKPDHAQRKDIWSLMIPKKMPIDKDVDVEYLASYDLTGGLIKNCLLGAARLAAAEDSKNVKKEHFDKAAERVKKSKSLMGKIRLAGGSSMVSGFDDLDEDVDVDEDVDIQDSVDADEDVDIEKEIIKETVAEKATA